MQPTGAENSASGSAPGTPSETPSDLGPFKPAARKVRLRLGKTNKLPSPGENTWSGLDLCSTSDLFLLRNS